MLDEKKKMMVVGALAVVMLGMGAFEFMPGKSAPPAPKAAKKTSANAQTVAKADASNDGLPVIKIDPETLPPRDPFEIPPSAQDPSTAQKQTESPQPRSVSGPAPAGFQTPHPRNPPTLQGNLPMLPMPTTVVPDSGHANAGQQASSKPAGQPDFGYHLSGVMLGVHPVAVFADKSGSEHLVSVGGSIDGDTKLETLSRDGATISFRGKKLRIPLGGDPVEK